MTPEEKLKRKFDAKVDDWVRMFRIGSDPDSPFAGMVDLTGIFKEPIELQRAVHAKLTPEQLDRVQKLYGKRAE